MNFIKDSFKYCYKHFLQLIVFVLPASVLLGLANPYRTISFFTNYPAIKVNSYLDMLNGMISFHWLDYVFGVTGVILLIFTISVFLAGTEYHLRTGKFSFKQSFKRFGNFFWPAVVAGLAFSVFMIILCFLMPAITYFIHSIVSRAGLVPTKLTISLVALVYITGYIIALLFLTVLLVAVNMMSINGYNFKSALSNSVGLLENNFSKMFFTLILPFAVMIPAVYFTSNFPWYPVVAIILFALQVVYTLSLSIVSFFKLTNTPRKDLENKFYIKGVK